MDKLSDDVIAFLSEGTRTGSNGVPGELVVRIRPTKVRKAFDLAN